MNNNHKHPTTLTDQELLQESKKIRTSAIINAVLVGVFIGIIFYSVIKNTWGLVTLIPLFFIYKLTNNSKSKKDEVNDELTKRNLK